VHGLLWINNHLVRSLALCLSFPACCFRPWSCVYPGRLDVEVDMDAPTSYHLPPCGIFIFFPFSFSVFIVLLLPAASTKSVRSLSCGAIQARDREREVEVEVGLTRAGASASGVHFHWWRRQVLAIREVVLAGLDARPRGA
jgi:hypothetical protein